MFNHFALTHTDTRSEAIYAQVDTVSPSHVLAEDDYYKGRLRIILKTSVSSQIHAPENTRFF